MQELNWWHLQSQKSEARGLCLLGHCGALKAECVGRVASLDFVVAGVSLLEVELLAIKILLALLMSEDLLGGSAAQVLQLFVTGRAVECRRGRAIVTKQVWWGPCEVVGVYLHKVGCFPF